MINKLGECSHKKKVTNPHKMTKVSNFSPKYSLLVFKEKTEYFFVILIIQTIPSNPHLSKIEIFNTETSTR